MLKFKIEFIFATQPMLLEFRYQFCISIFRPCYLVCLHKLLKILLESYIAYAFNQLNLHMVFYVNLFNYNFLKIKIILMSKKAVDNKIQAKIVVSL